MAGKKKFLILDGNSLIHRAFHALPPLKTVSGRSTNAVYGFTTMLMKLLDEIKPDYMAVAFDRPEPTFRHIEYSEYKAQRDKTPEELLEQFDSIKSIVGAFGIHQLELKGFEADDIIGTLACNAEESDIDTYIVTSDRDLLQLVGNNTYVLLTKRGISEMETYDVEAVKEKFQVLPELLPDLKGLVGDASDNIPGVPGIGPKTAEQLLEQFGTLENLLDNIDAVSRKRIRMLLRDNKNLATLSKRLATIVRDAPVDARVTDCMLQEPDATGLFQLFSELEFTSLMDRLRELTGEDFKDSVETSVGSPTFKIEVVNTKEALEKLKVKIEKEEMLTIKTVGNAPSPMTARVLGIGICTSSNEAFYVCANPGRGELDLAYVYETLKEVLESDKPSKVCHDAKYEAVLMKRFGVELRGLIFDAMIASYLLNPSDTQHDLNKVVFAHTGRASAWSEKFSAKTLPYASAEVEDMESETIGQLVCSDFMAILSIQDKMEAELVRLGMKDLFHEIELPLINVLASMEYTGVKVSQDVLQHISAELEKQLEQLTGEIHDIAGEEFNINSPKQLGHILFEKLKLPLGRKTKTGYSTDASTLESLRPYSPIADKVLLYRQLIKIKNTYADALGTLVNPETGRIHTTFNQTVTATGRLSSTEPNLQNIPIRTEEGRRIREAFVPKEGYIFVSADYSQIELRVLAHLSGDENLREAFRRDEDIHLRTAAEVSGIALDMVTPELRSRAKAVNFGIIYGISPFGLSRDLGIGVKEAELYIERYFRRYSGVKSYLEQTIQKAKEDGFVTTLFNRRRYLPELQSRNNAVRMFGERTAVNTPIQGTAADIIKIAMIRVSKALVENRVDARLILQVHDELLLEVAEADLDRAAHILAWEMEHAAKLEVPLKVDIKAGHDWSNMVLKK